MSKYQAETKKCQSCQKEFTVEPEDFEFYENIKVPAPTFCPECRLQRRLSWRNEITLHHRKCDLCGETMISIYHQDSPYKVYCHKCWYSDKWDISKYALDYDFTKSFFQQFVELHQKVPQLNLMNWNSVNSEYTNLAAENKNCYLLFESSHNENCSYGYWLQESRDCLDCSFVNKSEQCYETIIARSCYNISYSNESNNCMNSMFLRNCNDCSDCYGCVNLRHKKYHIFNKQYSREEYEKILKEKKEEIKKGNLAKLKKEFEDFAVKQFYKYASIHNAVNSSGNYLSNVKDCHFCFHTSSAENCKYGYHILRDSKDNMDVSTIGYGSERIYESTNVAINVFGVKFGVLNIGSNRDLEYSFLCSSSSNLFGCISAQKKEYCILNKQYSKEEYFKMVEKIKKQMNKMPYIDKQGREYKYGEFFPLELSPFPYNETIAQQHFLLTKKGAESEGYSWKDREKRNYEITLKNKDIPDDIKDVDNSILKEVIECATPKNERESTNCTEAFKIVPQELEFYKKMNLPLPRYCPNCRHHQRLKHRNPLKLYKRTCMKEGCNTEFETTYAPDRPEIVYCEKCYQEEVV